MYFTKTGILRRTLNAFDAKKWAIMTTPVQINTHVHIACHHNIIHKNALKK
jgi:hypothetical protein